MSDSSEMRESAAPYKPEVEAAAPEPWSHPWHDQLGLLYHRAIAEKIRREPELVETARAKSCLLFVARRRHGPHRSATRLRTRRGVSILASSSITVHTATIWPSHDTNMSSPSSSLTRSSPAHLSFSVWMATHFIGIFIYLYSPTNVKSRSISRA